MEQRRWGDKAYYSLDYYFRSIYGEKIYKLALHAGCTCPVRDGSIDTRGCIFCSEGGSGEFATPVPLLPDGSPDITAQLDHSLSRIADKFGGRYSIAYLQPYSNTYGDPERLKEIYLRLLSDERIIGLSIATRPDCLPPEILKVLSEVKDCFPEKALWIELGFQTMHPDSYRYIRRGYDNSVFEEAVNSLHGLGIPVVVHIILGLPGESSSQIYSTIEYLNTFPIFGIKLQLLHVLEGTDLAADYNARCFEVMTREEYVNLLIGALERLSPEIVVHRLTGDGPKNILIAPLWSSDKKRVLNELHAEMDRRGSYQGRLYSPPEGFNTL
ncbi:MAG: TIGR01212 family radical SAM protein [Lachnospiraceae bacterium]|nr:TIGR01212 family radical SAM protein [Lachnospiraceae bacterium]